MKKLFAAAVVAAVMGWGATASAVPVLQLEIGGGVYVAGSDETTVATGTTFDLYAFCIPSNQISCTSGNFFVSAALVPRTSPPGASLGSFVFAGSTVNVTDGMNYGVPPLEANLAQDSGDLSKHGIFETYFREFAFTFSAADFLAPYDVKTEDHIIANHPWVSGDKMYFKKFSVDTTGLTGGAIHFDLYNEDIRNGDIDVDKFAPFSHDAQSGLCQPGTSDCEPVTIPEPTSMLLLGSALVGLAAQIRRRR